MKDVFPEAKPRQYRRIDVYEHTGEQVLRYVCFELLSSGTYAVQSADYLRADQTDGQVLELEKQVVSLFQDMAPDDRLPACSTIKEAIEQFKARFE